MPQIADIFEALSGHRPNLGQTLVTHATHDSRLAREGSLFVALKGESVDGHDYVDHAFSQGAVAALVEQEMSSDINCVDLVMGQQLSVAKNKYPLCIRTKSSLASLQDIAQFWRSKLNIQVIGITGSVGKTTSKEMIYKVLAHKHSVIKSEGNYNNEIGLPLSIIGIDETHEFAVLEMGFYVPGEIALLAKIAQPQIGVLSTVGLVHAERAGSQVAIFEGKSELVQALPKHGTAILNRDDPLVVKMAERTLADVLFYGVDESADLKVSDINGLGLEGVEFVLHFAGEEKAAKVPMLGKHSVYTALRAAAVGLVIGMSLDDIVPILETGIADVRLSASYSKNGAKLLNDTYNASPQSTLAALQLLDEVPGRKIAVLGDMLELGRYETEGHASVGEAVADIADLLVTIGSRAETIAESAEEKGLANDAIHRFADSDAALNFLRQNIEGTDVLLVKGSRAMQMENIVPELEALP